MLSPSQIFFFNTQIFCNKFKHSLFPFFKKWFPLCLIRIKKIFNFSLFKFNRSEYRISRGYFIAETFSKLSNTERQSNTCRVNDVMKISKNQLSGFSTKISHSPFTLNDPKLNGE